MLKHLFGVCIFALGLAVSQARAGDQFRYDSKDGKCKDLHGKQGLNAINKADFLASKNGECGTFEAVGILHPSDAPKGVFKKFNFRGANFNSLAMSGGVMCGIKFTDADFSGARMNDMTMLYACVYGIRDKFTKVQNERCIVKGKSIKCADTKDQDF